MSPPGDEAQPKPDELTLPDALDLAKRAHKAGDLETAGLLYYRILEADPTFAEALHYAGLLQHQRGEGDEAVALIRQSLEAEPDRSGWHNNLGRVLIERGRPADATEAFGAALRCDPFNAEAHNNRAVALRLLDRPAEAEASYRKALEINPRYADALDNLGRLMVAFGRIREGIALYARARELEPHNERTRRHLVAAYGASGELDEARRVLDEWLAEEPDNSIALHMRASVTGEDVPTRASDGYVEALFDRFASSFDVQLAKLGYRAPVLVADALGLACGSPAGDLDICDAGCGTGLCGPLLRPYASRLTGVDLSDRMLDQARPRACYDALVKAELTRFLLAHPDRFDAIVSADTLCYFGSLGAVLEAASSALRAGGLLIFSVESTTEVGESRLNPHGRYSHNPAYVAAALDATGFETLDLRPDELRKEVGETVAGLLASARKPGPVPRG